MGLSISIEVEENCHLGLWEITEDYDTLFRMTYLNDEDIQRLIGFKNISRQLESMSVRALLQKMTKPDARIVYHESRKPYLADGSYNISISHSHNQTSILLSKDKRVGVDLEYMSHNIERIAHKFINSREIITENLQKRRDHLYIHWCAKEALYKICDKVDINFQTNLTIKPFEADDHGQITGIVHNNFRNEEYKMHYFIKNNYVLVYCIK